VDPTTIVASGSGMRTTADLGNAVRSTSGHPSSINAQPKVACMQPVTLPAAGKMMSTRSDESVGLTPITAPAAVQRKERLPKKLTRAESRKEQVDVPLGQSGRSYNERWSSIDSWEG
jgi:hypothetical protein